MKKTLIALAALAATGAFAQSSVTISGGFGLAFGTTKTGDANSGAQIARQTGNIAFKGTEDLGGGLKASFELQTAIGAVATTNNDTGNAAVSNNKAGLSNSNRTLLGDRAANVSLSGDFGAVVLGRGNTAIRSLWGSIGDVTGLPVVSGLSDSSQGSSDAKARVIAGDTFSNYLAYSTPNFSGLTASVALAPVQSTSAPLEGTTAAYKDTMSYTLQYAAGPLAVAANLTDMAATGGAKITTLLGSYDFGMVKVGLTTQSIDMNDAVDPGRATAITLSAPLGSGVLAGGYGRRTGSDGDGDNVAQTFLGYKYNLSKRTNVSAVWNKINREGSVKTNDVTETHLIVGHTF